ncbi:hypothetical protein HDU93_007146 [Gonapodya sp. JEL0774]|nr:hypothetical protein HDU93_007146 [Gonapodya sp. JEL0774]
MLRYLKQQQLEDVDVKEISDQIRYLIVDKVPYALTPEHLSQNGSPEVNERIIRPILMELRQKWEDSAAVPFCLLFLATKFAAASLVDLGYKTVWATRSTISFLVAARCLRYYDESDLTNALFFEFEFVDDGRFDSPKSLSEPPQSTGPQTALFAPEEMLATKVTFAAESYDTFKDERTPLLPASSEHATESGEEISESAMSLAIRLHALPFTSHPLVQATTHAIWNGSICILWEDLGDDEDRPRYRFLREWAVRDLRNESVVATAKAKALAPRTDERAFFWGEYSSTWRPAMDRDSWSYLASRHNLLDIEKLRVPRLQYWLSVVVLTIFVTLYILLTLVEPYTVKLDRFSPIEIAFHDPDETLLYNKFALETLAFLSLPLWLRFIGAFERIKWFGVVMMGAQKMLSEAYPFILLVIVFIVGFCNALFALAVAEGTDAQMSWFDILGELSKIFVGGFSYTRDGADFAKRIDPIWGQILFLTFSGSQSIVLMTILASFFSQAIQSIIKNAEAEFDFHLVQLVVDFAKNGDVYPFAPPGASAPLTPLTMRTAEPISKRGPMQSVGLPPAPLSPAAEVVSSGSGETPSGENAELKAMLAEVLRRLEAIENKEFK